MQVSFNWETIYRSIRGKVVLAFLAVCLVLSLAWVLTRVVLRDVAGSMRQVSAPNEKLMLVNRILEQVTRLDQLQRAHSIRKPSGSRSFLSETQLIRRSLDTLYSFSSGNAAMQASVDSMQSILHQRNQVYLDYIRLRSDQLNNKVLSARIKTLSELVQANARLKDSSIVTTERRTITESFLQQQQELSFFKRLFRRKKESAADSVLQKVVSEEVNVRIDTLAISQQDSMVRAIEDEVKRLEKEQHTRSTALLYSELRLLSNGNALVNELWTLLHQVQEKEIHKTRAETDSAILSMNKSIGNVGWVLVLFVVLIAVLAILILVDVSRSNSYRKQLQLAKEEAEHLGQVKQRFLSNMSHEIRTPLQSILGFSEQLVKQPEPDRKMLQHVNASATHLLQIVNEVLDYSRITSGHFSLEQRNFDLVQLLHEVAGNMQMQAEKKGLRFLFSNLPGQARWVNGDDFRLKQVLYNLLGNAVKFTSEGAVGLQAEVDGNGVYRFTVSDSGPGILKEDLQRIFHEFEQTDSSITRRFGGTGLGLSISRNLVESQGGKISVNSDPGQGSVFTVTLPLAAAPEPVTSSETELELPVLQKGCVVLVDDDELILQLCAAILTRYKVPYVFYTSAEELLEVPWNPETSIVFTDMRLPGMNGLELALKLKSMAAPGTRFVALTAQVLPDERQAVLNAGFDSILLKPFLEADFLACMGWETAGDELSRESDTTYPDISLLEKMSMNDEALLRKNLLRFVDDMREDIRQLELCLLENDDLRAMELVHRMAGRSGLIRSGKLLQRFRQIELALQQGEELIPLRDEVETALFETRLLLQKLLHMIPQDEFQD